MVEDGAQNDNDLSVVSHFSTEQQDLCDRPTSSPSCELEFSDDDMETVTVVIINAYVPVTSPLDTSEVHEDTFAHN